MAPPAPDERIAGRVRRLDPGARIEPLAGDASRRRYWRVRLSGGESRVLMDYGEPFEGITDDVRLSRLFESAGLAVATVHECWPEEGCLVLEDLGDLTLEVALGQEDGRERRYALLEQAVRLAAQVAGRGTPVLARSDRAAGPTLDAARFTWEMDFFVEHYVCALCELEAPPPGVRDALHELARLAADGPAVLCHRDFHSRNLLLRPDAGGLAMVDVQDARWGPDAYDLASLLRDAYAAIDDDWVEPLVALYVAELAEPPPEAAFARRFRLVAAQRMIKALGTFGFQVAVAGDRRYAPPIPRTLERLRALLPELIELPHLEQRLEHTGLLEIPPALSDPEPGPEPQAGRSTEPE